MVNKESYKATYDQAEKELSELLDERERLDVRRDEIDNRLVDLRNALNALALLCGRAPWTDHPDWFPEAAPRDIGLTSAVRQVLQKNTEEFLSPVAVRDNLQDVGYQIRSKNILPSIHSVLKRLDKVGVVEKDDRDGRNWYRWSGPVPPEDRAVIQLGSLLKAMERFTEKKK